jgi:hypothetical protein
LYPVYVNDEDSEHAFKDSNEVLNAAIFMPSIDVLYEMNDAERASLKRQIEEIANKYGICRVDIGYNYLYIYYIEN